MARFLLDENVSHALAVAIAKEAHEVLEARAVGLGAKPDEEVLAYAATHHCILVTNDQGFGDSFRHTLVATAPGVIVLRSYRVQTVQAQNDLTLAAIRSLDLNAIRGCLVVVSPGQVRVRKTAAP